MKKVEAFIISYKKSLIYAAVMLIVLTAVYFIMSNNYVFYSRSIIKIKTADKISSYDKTGTNGDTEKYYIQQLTGVVKNGHLKNKTVTFKNEYSYSSVTTFELKPGNEVFADIRESGGNLTAAVTGEKRDTYIILLLVIFAFVVLMASGRRGIFTLISVFINFSLFIGSLKVFGTGKFLNFMWVALLILFTVITLLFSAGLNKKSLGAIISTLCTTSLIILLYVITVYRHYDLPYDTMEYVVAFLPLKKIYLISIIFGCLGAIMDVSITVNSSIHELISVCRDELTMKSLIASVREIGRDIMGTMMNVLFFSYISGSIPIVVLKLTNQIGLNLVMKYDYIFDIIRFLIGSIGIVVSIPVSALIAVLLYKKGLKSK